MSGETKSECGCSIITILIAFATFSGAIYAAKYFGIWFGRIDSMAPIAGFCIGGIMTYLTMYYILVIKMRKYLSKSQIGSKVSTNESERSAQQLESKTSAIGNEIE